MFYCIKCGHEEKNKFAVCKKCGQPFVEALDHDTARTLVQRLHTNENVSHERVDSAMVFIVLGSIFLIIGALFFSLSYKLPDSQAIDKVLTFTCFEFYVSMAGIGAGGFMLIFGAIKLIINEIKLNRLKEKIYDLREAYLDN
jgi:hypothetical protein